MRKYNSYNNKEYDNDKYYNHSNRARNMRHREILKKKEKAKTKRSRKIGVALSFIQLILSVLFIGLLKYTDMIPVQYLMIAVIVFAVLFLTGYLTQYGKKTRLFGKIVSVITIIVICAISYFLIIAMGVLGNITGDNNFDGDITKDPFVVYLSGNDTYGDMSEEGRSDTNIIAVVNPSTQNVLLLSTPRDYYVQLNADYDYPVTEGFSGSGYYDKLTHAGNFGMGVSIGTLENLYNVDCDFYLKVNFTGFIDIVDGLGGITIENESEFTSWDGYYYPAGTLNLDGEYALNYARERHAFATGDNQRGINQMKIIKAMVEKASSPAILTGYAKIMASVSDNFETNMSQSNISSLVNMQLLKGIDWNIVSYSVTGSGSKSSTYSTSSSVYIMIPDDTSVANAQALIQSVLNGEEITQEYADSLN